MKWIVIGIAAVLVLGGFWFFGGFSDEAHGRALEKSMTDFFCKAANSEEKQEVLGFVEERDDVDEQWWGFIVCKETNLNTGEWRVKIFSSRNAPVTGTSLTTEQARQKAVQANAEGKEYFLSGEPYNQRGELDERKVEYRIYQENGEPTEIEVFLVLRNEDRSAKEPQILRVGWPA